MGVKYGIPRNTHPYPPLTALERPPRTKKRLNKSP